MYTHFGKNRLEELTESALIALLGGRKKVQFTLRLSRRKGQTIWVYKHYTANYVPSLW